VVRGEEVLDELDGSERVDVAARRVRDGRQLGGERLGVEARGRRGDGEGALPVAAVVEPGTLEHAGPGGRLGHEVAEAAVEGGGDDVGHAGLLRWAGWC
jgi:hypothetical protein